MNRYYIARRWPLFVMPLWWAVMFAAAYDPRGTVTPVGTLLFGVAVGLGLALVMSIEARPRDPEGGPR